MAIPAVVQQKLTGATLGEGEPQSSGGTLGGSRRVYVAEGPSVILYDSGGVFGSPTATVADLTEPGSLALRWADRGALLLVQARINAAKTVAVRFEGEPARAVAAGLAPLLPPIDADRGAEYGIETGLRCQFELDRPALLQALEARDPAGWAVAKSLLGSAAEPRHPRLAVGAVINATAALPAADLALLEHLYCGEMFVRVALHEGRLQLCKRAAGDVADLPCSQLGWEEDGLIGRVMVAGQVAVRVGLQIPDRDLRRRIREACTVGDDEVRGATDRAEVTGQSGTQAVDLVLTDDELELRARDGGQVHRFDLGHCGLSGESGDFLVVDDQVGPLRVQAASPRFQQLLLTHPGVMAAAERTRFQGPFLGVGEDGEPLSLHLGSPIEVRGGSPPPDAPVRYEADGEAPWLRVGDWSFSASEDVLEAVANHLTARRAADASVLAEELPTLEADWLLHTAFGPHAEAHEGLVEILGDPLRVTMDVTERLAVLTHLSERVPWLRRHTERVRLRLPTFVQACDAPVLDGDAPVLIRWKLDRLGDISRQLERIEAALAQLDWLRKALTATTPGYGKLAANLGLSVINPLRLIGSGAEAVRIVAVKQMVAVAEAEGAEEVAQACIAEWSHLVSVLLPAAAEDLLAGWQTPRTMLAQRLASGAGDAAAVALRYARLRNFPQFPDRPDGPPRRVALARIHRWVDDTPVGLAVF